MVDHHRLKLGKLEKKDDPRNVKFARYVNLSVLPTPPTVVDWTSGITDWVMYANDKYGDCTIASAAHQIMVWSAQVHGTPTVLPEQVVVDTYFGLSGGQDSGLVELDVLNHWRKVGINGRTIAAFAEVKPHEVEHVTAATWLFGGLYAGAALPISAQAQEVWDVVDNAEGEAGSWGGHAIPIIGADAEGLTCVTWGALKKMSWAWFFTLCR